MADTPGVTSKPEVMTAFSDIGVCGDFAEYFNADIVLMHFLWLLATILTSPLGIIAYIVAWIIMPECPRGHRSTAVTVNNR